MSVETVTPTEAEKYRAACIVGSIQDLDLQDELNRDIAQALAEQRAEIVGRYEALARELDEQERESAQQAAHFEARGDIGLTSGCDAKAWTYQNVASRIRNVAR